LLVPALSLISFLYLVYSIRSTIAVDEYYTLYPKSIEKNIHQSWKSTNLPALSDADSWKRLNPGYNYTMWTDAECDRFVQQSFPRIYPFYQRLPRPVLKADLFRYLVVLEHGGVWGDIDTKCLKSIDVWSGGRNVSAIIGVEFDSSDHIIDWFSEVKLQFVQWAFAAAKGHPMMHHVVDTIIHRHFISSDQRLKGTEVLELTGPTIWTEAILNYLAVNGFHDYRRLQRLTKGVVVGDVLVLPITSFKPDSAQGGKGNDYELSFVEHLWMGSWKGHK